MVRLVKGSIFNSKCDLIVIPCNNAGGVSQSVHNEIWMNGLPYLNRLVPVGDISLIPASERFANASMVGYASSVDIEIRKSTEEIIYKIMKKIKYYCREQALQKVNIPLLGSGTGGLSPSSSYNIMRSEFENDKEILLCIYVASEEIYKQLYLEGIFVEERKIKNPRVFISYTGLDIKNRNWVKKFAYRLRENGINARLDMFHLKPGQDLPQWMTNELIMADKVLLICDKYYAERADNRNGGVGWETMIIQGDMLLRQMQNKYIAILRDKNIDQSLPIYIKSKYALNWSDDEKVEEGFNELLLYLFDCDIEPPIGEIPDFVKEKINS